MKSKENTPQPIKLYVCPDGSVYDNEDVAKSHAASIFNPLPAGATTTDQVYLEQDPYAEQRKWIGKACWFWDEDRKDAFCDVLGYVDENSKYPYVNVDCYSGYKHCEPVKPDDDIIYKGGDNE